MKTPQKRKQFHGKKKNRSTSQSQQPVADKRCVSSGKGPQDTSWEQQASLYDARHGESGDDIHRRVVIPSVIRQLSLKPGQHILDCCCGQGVFARALSAQGVQVTGLDMSPSLIALAEERAGADERFICGDARELKSLCGKNAFDHAAVVLALQDLDPLAPVLSGLAEVLKARGRLVMVLTHPCFRVPRHSDWFRDETGVRYRQVDTYLRPFNLAIRTHPSQKEQSVTSHHFHRPISSYINELGRAGFGLVASEELTLPNRGSTGKQTEEDERSASEIPVFMVLTAKKL